MGFTVKIARYIAIALLSFVFWGTNADDAFALQLQWPTDSTRITSEMGCRTPPKDADSGAVGSSMHLGVDVGAVNRGVGGDALRAPMDGTITGTGSHSGGNFVTVTSNTGNVRTTFMHMQSQSSYSRGQSVSMGQTIGSMGNTGVSSGVHLDYRVEVMHNGSWHFVDPVSAQGQDLSDPAVIARLLDQSVRIQSCAEQGSNAVNSTAGSGGGGGESCNAEILSTGKQLAESRMNIEKQMIDEAISRPQSVMELSCFDQFGEMFADQIGGIFGNTEGDLLGGTGLDLFGFNDIFGSVQSDITNQIQDAVNEGLLGGRGESISSSFTSMLQGALGSVGGGGGGAGGFNCGAMNTLWKIMQCEGILDFKIPSLDDLINVDTGSGANGLAGLLDDLRPDSCAGQVLYDQAIEAATRNFNSFGESAPSRP